LTDDYYSLIGVEPDADVDAIRVAYRERKETAAGDDAKKLNKAWNVLSDPYQRGRYDEQRSHSVGTVDEDDIEVVDDEPSTTSKNGSRPARGAQRQGPKQLKPTITLPKGMQFASRKQRLIAMVIDLVLLFVMFFGITQVAAPAYAKHQKPEVVNAINNYQDQIDAWNKVKANAPKAAKGATNHTTQFADDQIKAITKKRDDEISKLNSILFGSLAIAFLLGFLYLVLPSMKGGQTLGKRLQRIRVVRDDGSPIRSGDIIRRYGIIVLATFALYIILRELAGAVVLLGTTRWIGNANQQGMHDRFAHTIVVADET
jgi:uncharacterized RDD family membrane protein YckC